MEALILNRIRDLLVSRQWYRTHFRATWTTRRVEHETELRALVRLMRQYRKAQRDPYPVTMTYATWTEAEKAEAFGR